MLKKNDRIPLTIESLSSDGSGVGRVDDFVIFTPMTCTGDRVRAHILKVKKSYAFAKVDGILTPSADRVEPDCAIYRQCGGCDFRHMHYEAELREKRQAVDDALRRIGGLELTTEQILFASPLRYRNKAQYPLREEEGNIKAGFFAKHSHRVINCEDCLLEPEIFGKIVQALQWFMQEKHISAYDESSHTGLVRHLFLRCSKDAAQLALCLVLNGAGLPCEREFAAFMSGNFPALKSIMLNVNTQKTNVILGKEYRCIFGREYIEDILLGKRFRIGAASFYQVNHDMCEKLYTKAAEYAALQPGETLLDLYCGAGTVGICLAPENCRLIGVDIVPEAVENARENAALNDLNNAEFLCADAAAATAILKEKGLHADCVVIDPPRKGCDERTIENIVAFGAQRLVYISCNPATLARDLKILQSRGYKAERACAADLFPRTAHCECVVRLIRN
ncbi:MAG: 23S rRNA (uracil(1939)-C(5))-methyltransferase RlmD [Clostridia bacterium]|nr:23S rRNA (uracil(1939)-C(5))-methyltransferase RlmD [Clostridia bacterium]